MVSFILKAFRKLANFGVNVNEKDASVVAKKLKFD